MLNYTQDIIIRFPNSHEFSVPIDIIAKNRAEYYAEEDGFEIDGDEYKKEYDYCFVFPEEAIDWLTGNMDWIDIKEHATLLPKREINYDEEFYRIEACLGNEYREDL